MIYTTLNKILAHDPCADRWFHLLRKLGKDAPDDEPLALVRILELNGLSDALWATKTTACSSEARLFAVACARDLSYADTDQVSLSTISVAERFANGDATLTELLAAWDKALAYAQTFNGQWLALRAATNTAMTPAYKAAWATANRAAEAQSPSKAGIPTQTEHFVRIFG